MIRRRWNLDSGARIRGCNKTHRGKTGVFLRYPCPDSHQARVQWDGYQRPSVVYEWFIEPATERRPHRAPVLLPPNKSTRRAPAPTALERHLERYRTTIQRENNDLL